VIIGGPVIGYRLPRLEKSAGSNSGVYVDSHFEPGGVVVVLQVPTFRQGEGVSSSRPKMPISQDRIKKLAPGTTADRESMCAAPGSALRRYVDILCW